MSELKWIFDLRQHTPIIHFQPTDIGVCLRATEVKPKFDKFLLKHQIFTENQKQQWFYQTEDGQLSSKMKLRFEPKGKMVRTYEYECRNNKTDEIPRGIEERKIHPLYFGNQGCRGRENIKEAIFFDDGIKGSVQCFSTEFLKVIKEYMPIFFLLYNFGTRQDKGFGSFSISGNSRVTDVFEKIKKYEPNAYCLDYQILGKNSKITKKERLDDIQLLYGIMKGGINNTKQNLEQYYKGAIFRYYLEKGIVSEKKVMKEFLFNGNEIGEDREPRYIRGALGIANQYSYSTDNNKKIRVFVTHNTIKRYSSPIYFKVLGRYTFLFLRHLPGELKNEEFLFSVKRSNQSWEKKLALPDFNIEDFMQWFAEDFNNKEKIVNPEGNLIRGSLKAVDNPKFKRIERLQLRRCVECI